MKSLLIGSPLLSSIRKGGYLSSQVGLSFNTMLQEYHVLKEISPRALQEAMTAVSVLDVTVIVYSYRATSVVFLAKTTFTITTGNLQRKQLIEYSLILGSQFLRLQQVSKATTTTKGAQLCHVWTSPVIMDVATNYAHEPLSLHSQLNQFRA